MSKKKEIRKNFKNAVFKRDHYTCKVCNTQRNEEDLDAHHITDRNEMPNGGYVASNGITVCKEECHMMVEEFHISGGKNWCDDLHPTDLYNLIGSSHEQAIEDSNQLL